MTTPELIELSKAFGPAGAILVMLVVLFVERRSDKTSPSTSDDMRTVQQDLYRLRVDFDALQARVDRFEK